MVKMARATGKGTKTKASKKTTNRGGDKMVNKVKDLKPMEKTATEQIREIMQKHPEMTGAEIARETGIPSGTVYTVQSRLRAKARKEEQKAGTITKKEHTAVGDVGQLDKMLKVSETLTVPVSADKAELFSFITAFYLDKITHATTDEEIQKYHNLLMDMLGR